MVAQDDTYEQGLAALRLAARHDPAAAVGCLVAIREGWVGSGGAAERMDGSASSRDFMRR